jgi:hypothetical protein
MRSVQEDLKNYRIRMCWRFRGGFRGGNHIGPTRRDILVLDSAFWHVDALIWSILDTQKDLNGGNKDIYGRKAIYE